MKIAYIFYTEEGPLAYADTEHDSLLQFLQQKGLDIQREQWSDETVDWTKYQCIVLKSPWDYVVKLELFYHWLETIKRLNILLLNPVDIVRWNCDKHYLQDIAAAGLNVIPTAFIEKGSSIDAAEHFNSFSTDQLIVKPCVSGSSKNTFKVSKTNGENIDTINKLLQNEAMMVQPFMPEIAKGEWSFVFLGGSFSHSLVKIPSSDEFRSQPQFGGSIAGRLADQAMLDSATQYISQFAQGCLYARVDGLIVDGQFQLMELELIDPYLFLFTYPEGYNNYYNSLSAFLT